MDTITMIVFIVMVVIAVLLTKWIISLLTTHGKNTADKLNQSDFIKQLAENTKIVKEIEHKLTQDTWVKQQVWLKKQEIYDDIFKIFLDIDKYLNYEESALDEYTWYEHGIYQFIDNASKEELDEYHSSKKAYHNKFDTDEYKQLSDKYKNIKQRSIESLAIILQIKALFLSQESKTIISSIIDLIKPEPNSYEEWESYVNDSLITFKKLKKELLLSAERELLLLV